MHLRRYEAWLHWWVVSCMHPSSLNLVSMKPSVHYLSTALIWQVREVEENSRPFHSASLECTLFIIRVCHCWSSLFLSCLLFHILYKTFCNVLLLPLWKYKPLWLVNVCDKGTFFALGRSPCYSCFMITLTGSLRWSLVLWTRKLPSACKIISGGARRWSKDHSE